ncbi:3065_t:CDS:2, partial [Ambispora gerdemannii]
MSDITEIIEFIKERVRPCFDSIPANELRIWKLKYMLKISKNKLFKTVGKYINESPTSNDICIIVQAFT